MGVAGAANNARSRVTSHLYLAQGSAATVFFCENAGSGTAQVSKATKISNRIVRSPGVAGE
jgi:hypothetical protein